MQAAVTESRSNEQRAAGQVGAVPLKQVVGDQAAGAGAPAEAAVLQPAVRILQPHPDDADAGVERLLGEHVQRARGHARVVVEQHQRLAARGGGTGVVAAGEVAVLGQRQHARSRLPGAEEVERVVGRGVVDQHQLDVAAEPVAEGGVEALQAALAVRALAVRDDHDREGGDHLARVIDRVRPR